MTFSKNYFALGQLVRKQEFPRAKRPLKQPNDYYEDFITLCANGDREEAFRLFERYKRLNSNPSESSRGQADGLLIGFIERGARARMLASVFNVGRGRYERLKSGAPRMTPGGKCGVDSVLVRFRQTFLFKSTG